MLNDDPLSDTRAQRRARADAAPRQETASATAGAPPRPTVFIAHPSDILTDHLPNGDGLIAHGFIRELARRGYRLHIATREVGLREKLPPNVTLYPIPGRFRNELLDRLHYMARIRGLLRHLRRREPIGLVHQMNPVFTGLSLSLLFCGVPLVLGTYVARWPDERRTGIRNLLTAKASAAARNLITFLQQLPAAGLLLTTRAALNRVPAPTLSTRKIHTIRHGVDTDLFSPPPDRESRTRPDHPPSILFYSHLDRRKGIFVLVEAFREVAKAIPDCVLTLVGRGDHVEEVERAVAASGCADRIRMIGKVDRGDAPALLRSHNVYCLPSFGEPYATTILEAMACAMPLVVTNTGGLPYMVPENGGILVPEGDPQALAAALVQVLCSPALQRAMGSANRAFIERHHDWAKVVDDLEVVYRAVTNSPRPEGQVP